MQTTSAHIPCSSLLKCMKQPYALTWFIFLINKRWKCISALFNIPYISKSCTRFKRVFSSCPLQSSVQVTQSKRSRAAEAAGPWHLYRMYSFMSNLSLKTSSDGCCGMPGQPPPLLTHLHKKFFLISLLKFPANRDSWFSVDVKNIWALPLYCTP